MAKQIVTPVSDVDKSDNFNNVLRGREASRERLLNLAIEPAGDHFRLSVVSYDSDLLKLMEPCFSGIIPLTSAQLWGIVHECRMVWRKFVIDAESENKYIFQEEWDFRDSKAVLQKVLPKIAWAGYSLFQSIFLPDGTNQEVKCTRKIGEVLREVLSEKSAWIKVTSDTFYAPWNLIYSLRMSGPDDSKVDPKGLWGFQHLVEHVPFKGELPYSFSEDVPLQIGVQLDDRIDRSSTVNCNSVVNLQLNSYAEGQLEVFPRYNLPEFQTAMEGLGRRDHVLYFCCHAKAEGDEAQFRLENSYLQLSDEKPITPSQLKAWLDDSHFERHPIVFINACQSAQVNSVFYQGFAPLFFSRSASSLVGTQTEIPAVFAGQFASNFFDEFFGGSIDESGQPSRRLGDVLWELRRHYFDKHNNPIGMLYSLYRGGDVFLRRPLESGNELSNELIRRDQGCKMFHRYPAKIQSMPQAN